MVSQQKCADRESLTCTVTVPVLSTSIQAQALGFMAKSPTFHVQVLTSASCSGRPRRQQ